MIARVLAAGIVGGIVTGLIVATLQHVTTTPMIVSAEVYEAAQHVKQHVVETAGPAGHIMRRTLSTSISTIVLSVGYALILLATMLAAGDRITPRRAALWGACAFAATGLATSIGLAPQLPGAAETELAGRQLWWSATALTTAAGLYALLRSDDRLAQVFGLSLLVAPHIFTPTPASPESTAPAELAARFAAASLAIQAVSWVLAGALAGMAFRSLVQDEDDAPA